MDAARRDDHPGQRGEHNERHHARLHQLHEVADARLGWADAADLGFYARPLHLSPAAPRARPCLIARLFSPLLAVSIATGGTEPPRPPPLSNLKPRAPSDGPPPRCAGASRRSGTRAA